MIGFERVDSRGFLARGVPRAHAQKPRDNMATITNLRAYVAETVSYRDFWLALAGIDLRNRFRRTSIGVLWLIVHPLAFTLILSLMFHFLFNQPLQTFSVYVFSGVIFWAWFSESFLLGSGSLLNSQMFIRQKRLPLIGYSIRTAFVSLATYLMSFVGLIAWSLLMGNSPNWLWLLLPLNILLMAVTLFPLTVISGILGVLYRDFQQAVQIVLQALWFMSPVFMDKTVFTRPELRVWDQWNPISSMLELIRKPFMENELPSVHSYLMTVGCGLIFYVIAYRLLRRHEDAAVYYM